VPTPHRRFKDAIYEQLARIGKASAAPKRLELLDLLCQGPRTVEALAKESALSVANASQHLRVLRAARLVEGEKKGLYVEYRLADDQVCRFLVALRGLAQARLTEIESVKRAFLAKRESMEPVPADELLRRVRAGEVTLIDVRPVSEYRAGHIPGALSVPLSELRARLEALPRNREIVAYCRGPYCAYAHEAVRRLSAAGRPARRLEDGWPEWQLAEPAR
jgi:rhodanese-related sulfurtransferase/DNA-binding transcriptional ArsR family regulator